MRLLISGKIVGCTTLLMAYSPVSNAMTTQSDTHYYLVLGILLGFLISLLLGVYLKRHYRKKYLKILRRLKLAKSNTKIVQQEMKILAKEQHESHELLEERVQERTLELNIALQELANANQELERKNILDELTGLYNRRFYDKKILAEYRRSRRTLSALTLILIDVDHFKLVNDNHGHLAGDQCLVWLAQFIKNSLKRSADKAFRYGGEEFCLILPNTNPEGALLLAEQLRLQVCEQVFKFQGIELSMTISCGICTYRQQIDIEAEQIFSGADQALYKAKHNGRNQTQQYIFTE